MTMMKRKRTTNQLTPTPMRMPKTRASWKFVRGATTCNGRPPDGCGSPSKGAREGFSAAAWPLPAPSRVARCACPHRTRTRAARGFALSGARRQPNFREQAGKDAGSRASERAVCLLQTNREVRMTQDLAEIDEYGDHV